MIGVRVRAQRQHGAAPSDGTPAMAGAGSRAPSSRPRANARWYFPVHVPTAFADPRMHPQTAPKMPEGVS